MVYAVRNDGTVVLLKDLKIKIHSKTCQYGKCTSPAFLWATSCVTMSAAWRSFERWLACNFSNQFSLPKQFHQHDINIIEAVESVTEFSSAGKRELRRKASDYLWHDPGHGVEWHRLPGRAKTNTRSTQQHVIKIDRRKRAFILLARYTLLGKIYGYKKTDNAIFTSNNHECSM